MMSRIPMFQVRPNVSQSDLPDALLPSSEGSDLSEAFRHPSPLTELPSKVGHASDGGKPPDGTSLTPTPISASDLSGYAWKITRRGAYKSAVATGAELGTAVTHSETAGEGTPCHKLRHK